MNPKASCGVLCPPLRGIVQLTNSATLSELEFHNKLSGKDARRSTELEKLSEELYILKLKNL
jgi:hypothetical protein